MEEHGWRAIELRRVVVGILAEDPGDTERLAVFGAVAGGSLLLDGGDHLGDALLSDLGAGGR